MAHKAIVERVENPRSTIYKSGDLGESMYFVIRGFLAFVHRSFLQENVGGIMYGSCCYRRPARYHRYSPRVVVVSTPPAGVVVGANERLVQLTCPSEAGPGAALEIQVDGRLYYVTVPDGVGPGQPFQARW